MAPKKDATKKDEKKPEKKVISPELKALIEKEKAIEKVSAPDRTQYDKDCEDVQTAIAGLQERRLKIDEKISAKSVGKEEHNGAKEEIRSKLKEYSTKIDELETKRQSAQGSIRAKQQEGKDRRQELNTMKKKLGYDSEADIDQKIRDIEYELQTESFTLKQEKERLVQISELRRTKPLVTKYNKMEGIDVAGDVSSLKESVDNVFAELKELRDARRIQQAALAKLNEARQKVMGDVPELFTEREAIKSQIRDQFQKKNELRDTFNIANRGFNAYMNDIRQIRGERARLERNAREEEWKAQNKAEKEAEGPPPAPFESELSELDNLLNHFKALLPTKEAEKEVAQAESAPKAAQGQMVLMGKDQREEEFFFAATKKKGLRKKGGGASKKALVHALATLSCCEKFKVNTPHDVSAVPASLVQVEAKVAEYKEKQKKALEKKEKKEEDKTEEKAEEKAEETPAEAVAA